MQVLKQKDTLSINVKGSKRVIRPTKNLQAMELQPMDKSVFKAFESYWDEEVMKYLRTHPDRRIMFFFVIFFY